MSRTARFVSSSLAALGVAIGALSAGAGEAGPPAAPAPKPVVRVVGMVPAADTKVQAALVRGIEKALKHASTARVRWVLEVSPAPKQWSNAGPATVDLIFGRGAAALITPPERRVAHLMAQVATRVQVPLVTTSAAPTVATTGSNVLQRVEPAAGEKTGAPDWVAVGTEAGRRAVAGPSRADPRPAGKPPAGRLPPAGPSR